jgi:hypothetical protein
MDREVVWSLLAAADLESIVEYICRDSEFYAAVKECFSGLRKHEETKGLEDIFMMRMHRLNAVGLPISADDAFRRVADAIVVAPRTWVPSSGLHFVFDTGRQVRH